MDGNDPDTLHTTSGPPAIGLATAFARDFARVHRLDADAGARLAIVVEELVTNLVEHAGAPGSAITLRLAPSPGAVDITLVDAGARFDPRDAVTSAPVPPACGGGAGLALVLAWTVVTNYHRESGRNRLSLKLSTR